MYTYITSASAGNGHGHTPSAGNGYGIHVYISDQLTGLMSVDLTFIEY